MSGQVFISASSTDLHLAASLCNFIESRGISCWMAPRNIECDGRQSDAWDKEVATAIMNCRLLLFLSTESTIDRPDEVAKEIKLAEELKKFILPVIVDARCEKSDIHVHLSRYPGDLRLHLVTKHHLVVSDPLRNVDREKVANNISTLLTTECPRTEWATFVSVALANFSSLLRVMDSNLLQAIREVFFHTLADPLELTQGERIANLNGRTLIAFGDGDSGRCETRALAFVQALLREAPKRVLENLNIEIDLRIGISTGLSRTVHFGERCTYISESIDKAIEIQRFCDLFELRCVMDDTTYNECDWSGAKPVLRELPAQRLAGFSESLTLYELNLDTENHDYFERFNAATTLYANGNYSAALSFFAAEFASSERKAERKLLQEYATRCFRGIEAREELFHDAPRYKKYSCTQKQQGHLLIRLVQAYVDKTKIHPTSILDVGCGTGELTNQLAAKFELADVVGIDISPEQIDYAKRNNTKPYGIEFHRTDVCHFSPDNQFDLIFSNSAMHWVTDQQAAYENLRRLLTEPGLLAVHTGHKDCYQELQEAAVLALESLGYEDRLNGFEYPLVYYTKEEMERLLLSKGFEPISIKVRDILPPKSLIDDFSEAGLLPYRRLLPTSAEEKAFVQRYKEIARSLEKVSVSRLYAVAIAK